MGLVRKHALITLLLSLLVFPSIIPVIPYTPAVSANSNSTDTELIQPQLSASAALAIDLTTGTQLYALEADTALPPASTVKIVGALLVRDLLPLDQEIEIIESDLVDATISRVDLIPGDILTVEQLLYGALVVSGADAVNALARTAGLVLDPETDDPIGRFVQEMNTFAQQHGMLASTFTNPIGLDDPNELSSARDLARASVLVLDDWLLRKIVGTPTVTLNVAGPNARDIELWSTNQLVQTGEAIGVKTGTEIAAGECLISAFRIGGHVVLIIVLGSDDRYADVATILATLEEQVEWVQLGSKSDSLGATAELAEQGLWMPAGRTILMTEAESEKVSYSLELESESGPNGERGNVVFKLGDEILAILPVYSASESTGGTPPSDEQQHERIPPGQPAGE